MSAARGHQQNHWTFKLVPLEDELLSSWLCRVAHAHGMTPHAFLALHWPAREIWTRDIDRSADDGWLADVAQRSGLPLETVVGLTLKPLMPVLAGGRRRDFSRGDAPLVLSAGVFHRTRVRHALQYCPLCIAVEEPHFRRSWRLGFVVACEKHQSTLCDSCPNCGVPVEPHRAPIGSLSTCPRCSGSLASAALYASSGGDVAAALRLQRRLTCELVGETDGPPRSRLDGAGAPFLGRDGFAALRSLHSVTTNRRTHLSLREHLGCRGMPPDHDRLQFEKVRVGNRIRWQETIEEWSRNWASRFAEGAAAAGITQRTFARPTKSEAIMRELPTLKPGGQRRRKPWQSILDDKLMRRLKRTDPAAWRQLRAARILAGKAVPPC